MEFDRIGGDKFAVILTDRDDSDRHSLLKDLPDRSASKIKISGVAAAGGSSE